MRTRILAVFAALLIATLGACGGSGASGSGGGNAGGAPPGHDISTTMTIWSYNEPDDFPYIGKWIDRFNKKYPNVKVDWVWIEQQKLTSKLLGSAISGDAPDGIFFNPAAAPQLADAGILRDLTSYWKGYEHKGKFPDSVVARYKGNVLSVQPYVNISAIWYNKDILKKLGVTPPDSPISFSEFGDILAKATRQGYTGMTLACEPSEKGEFTILPWLLSQGVNYGDFEQQPTSKVFSMFRKWSNKGYIPKDCVGWTGAVAFQKFLGGDVAFTYNGNWQLSSAKENADFDFGVMQVPAGSAGSHAVPGGEAVGITQQSEHPDLVWEFWKTALSHDGELTALDTNGCIPARSDLADAPAIKQSPVLSTYAKVVANAGNRPPSTKIYKAMQTTGRIFNAVVGGKMDGPTAARKLRQKTAYVE